MTLLQISLGLCSQMYHISQFYKKAQFPRHFISADLSCCRASRSSLVCAFICCTSMESGRRRRMYSSWLPIDNARIRLLMRILVVKNTKSYRMHYETSKYQWSYQCHTSDISTFSVAVTNSLIIQRWAQKMNPYHFSINCATYNMCQ